MAGILTFGSFYYAVVGPDQSSSRQGLVLLCCIQLLVYTSTFAAMTIASLPDAMTASGLVSLLTLMSILFNGVLQTPGNLPGFWMFMYRVSPFTYWVGGMVATMLAGRPGVCGEREVSVLDPPAGQSCGQYLQSFARATGGTIQNPEDSQSYRYCSLSNADQFLAGSNIFYGERWRNFGIIFAFIIFNVFVAVLTYWLFRVANLNYLKRPFSKGKKGPMVKESVQQVTKEGGHAPSGMGRDNL
jgi:ABC-type multidrug transport system permease subunit